MAKICKRISLVGSRKTGIQKVVFSKILECFSCIKKRKTFGYIYSRNCSREMNFYLVGGNKFEK
ncbi:hypothetical protein BTO06_00510 [Tenacibaculum sp. SZ-18]|nr:hypothetical protein BTO06_00510 [Tenacibaculum sp. SZ-18]